MTRLSGEFQTDLPLPEALAACAEAVHGLGWHIESVGGERVVSYAGTASTQYPPRIEMVLHDSGHATDIRITGADSDAHPLDQDVLIAELDRVRDAIKAQADAIPGVATDPEMPGQLEQVPPRTETPPIEAQPPAETVDAEIARPVKRRRREVLPPEEPPAIRPVRGGRLESEKVIISAPMSYAGSAARIWRISRMSDNGAATAGLIALAVLLIGLAWVAVTAWYIVTYAVLGLLFIPYRLIRRGNRKRKMENLRHREQLESQRQVQELLRQQQRQR